MKESFVYLGTTFDHLTGLKSLLEGFKSDKEHANPTQSSG